MLRKIRRRAARYAWDLAVNGAVRSCLVPPFLRAWLLRAAGCRIGRRVRLARRLELHSNRLEVGDRVFVNVDVVIDNRATVVLEDDVALAPRVLITTTGHEIGRPERRQGPVTAAPTRIGRGTWVGAGAVILPGVTIGPGCVIAAGAVVRRDCKPNSLYAGVPAEFVKELA